MCKCVIWSIEAFRFRRFVLAFLLHFGIVGSALLVSTAQADESYKLAPGDRIGITVFGNSELSGDFEINGSGRIIYPVVGSIDLGGLDLKDAEQHLVTTLSEGILVNPSVFVRITELRPIQVIGDVRNSGSFPFRSGTIVKRTVGLAGGYGMSLLSPGTAAAEFLTAEERLKVLQSNNWPLQLRHAHLAAQLKQQSQLEVPPTNDVPNTELSKAIAEAQLPE